MSNCELKPTRVFEQFAEINKFQFLDLEDFIFLFIHGDKT